ncbi:hypothetical protein GCM10009665_11580 [Kitasatospora nipponensis]|uniref:N-acetyltransferase domain-containing protein n=2 Tax=Kitasatospora nipponensis TaxID=258049 RepID=A0ABP4GEU8_9ACTN
MRGTLIGLRARHEDDVPILHHELYEDVPTRAAADTRPWVPVPAGSDQSPFAVTAPNPDVAFFSIVLLETGELAGEALLWGIDTHNRVAHLGLALRPAFRGRGLGTDTVRVLCEYGFAVRGLRRLQLETLSGNGPMVAAARGAGFVHEGTLRSAAWVYGAVADEVLYGLLAEEWKPA